jgi:hypothetical protein
VLFEDSLRTTFQGNSFQIKEIGFYTPEGVSLKSISNSHYDSDLLNLPKLSEQ